jgi:hypothetical protein
MSHISSTTKDPAHFESDLELKSNTLQPRPDVPIPQHPLKKKAIQTLLAAGTLTMIVIWANVLWLFGSLYNAHSYVHRLEVSGMAPSTVLPRLASTTYDMLNFSPSHIFHI